MKFEDLFTAYSVDVVDYSQFVLNALLAALLTWILSIYYRKFGHAVGNRSQFGSNFMLLALTTMLIIYIVKSSIALSLGLVGALSIVRFRAAIKEPEELTYLFLVIGIGLGMGANQPVITIIAFFLILALLFLSQKNKKSGKTLDNQMVVNISSSLVTEDKINEILEANFDSIELRRLSYSDNKTYITYVIEAKKFEQITQTKKLLLAEDGELHFSFIDNKNMIG